MPAYVKPPDVFDAVLAAQRHLLGWQKRPKSIGRPRGDGPGSHKIGERWKRSIYSRCGGRGGSACCFDRDPVLENPDQFLQPVSPHALLAQFFFQLFHLVIQLIGFSL